MAGFYTEPASILGKCGDQERFRGSGGNVCVSAASQIYASSESALLGNTIVDSNAL